jgi:hypothetical protein
MNSPGICRTDPSYDGMLFKPSNVMPPLSMKRKIKRKSNPAAHKVDSTRAVEARIDMIVVISDWAG